MRRPSIKKLTTLKRPVFTGHCSARGCFLGDCLQEGSIPQDQPGLASRRTSAWVDQWMLQQIKRLRLRIKKNRTSLDLLLGYEMKRMKKQSPCCECFLMIRTYQGYPAASKKPTPKQHWPEPAARSNRPFKSTKTIISKPFKTIDIKIYQVQKTFKATNEQDKTIIKPFKSTKVPT